MPRRAARKSRPARRSYKRSTTRRAGSGLSYPALLLAKSMDRKLKYEKLQEDLNLLRMPDKIGEEDVIYDPLGRVQVNALKRRQGLIASGRGAYNIGRALNKFSKGSTGRSLLRAGAAALDPYTGGLASTALDMSGRGMYTGHGEYETNSLVGGGVAPEVPQVSSIADETGAVTVSRREYLCDIYGPTTSFNVQSYSLNPGLETTFPWLAQIASNYDEYEIQQLIFTYRSTTTDVGTTTTGQCGTVIMCTNYNAAAAPFTDKAVMMEYDGAMSCKTTESMIHGVECDPAKLSGSAGKYVRSNPVLTNQDLKSYDLGLFQIAVANSPTGFENQTIGELWVSYTVTLRKPKFYTSRGLAITRDIFVSGAGTETSALLLGTDAALLRGQQNNLGAAIACNSQQIQITFPAHYAGFVQILLLSEGVTTNASCFNVPTSTECIGNVALVSDIYGTQRTTTDSPASSCYTIHAQPASGQLMFMVHLKVSPASDGVDNKYLLTYVSSTITVAPNQSQLVIEEYNSGFSYAAQNLGSSYAPILVNASGQIVVP